MHNVATAQSCRAAVWRGEGHGITKLSAVRGPKQRMYFIHDIRCSGTKTEGTRLTQTWLVEDNGFPLPNTPSTPPLYHSSVAMPCRVSTLQIHTAPHRAAETPGKKRGKGAEAWLAMNETTFERERESKGRRREKEKERRSDGK